MAPGPQTEFDTDHKNTRSPTPDAIADPPSEPAGGPVFVDTSGRRRRWVRLISCGVGLACASYTAIVGLSLICVPVIGQDLLPLAIAAVVPQAQSDDDDGPAHAAPEASARGNQAAPNPWHHGQPQGPVQVAPDNPGSGGGGGATALPMPAASATQSPPAATAPPTPPVDPTPSPSPTPTASPTLTVTTPAPTTEPTAGPSTAQNLVPTAGTQGATVSTTTPAVTTTAVTTTVTTPAPTPVASTTAPTVAPTASA